MAGENVSCMGGFEPNDDEVVSYDGDTDMRATEAAMAAFQFQGGMPQPHAEVSGCVPRDDMKQNFVAPPPARGPWGDMNYAAQVAALQQMKAELEAKYAQAAHDAKHDGREVKQQAAQVHVPGGDIPGFSCGPKQPVTRTEFYDEKWLRGELKKAIGNSEHDFSPESIRKRKSARSTIATRESDCDVRYQRAKRAFAKEKSILNETQGIDTNVEALRVEIAMTQKHVDPVGRTAMIKAQRAAKRREQEEHMAQVAEEQERLAAERAAEQEREEAWAREAEERVAEFRSFKRLRKNVPEDEPDSYEPL